MQLGDQTRSTSSLDKLKHTIRRKFSQGQRAAIKSVMEELKCTFVAREGSRAFRPLRGKRDLKLHLGCGRDIKAGWVNIDLDVTTSAGFDLGRSDTVVFRHDLRRGLNLEAGSCAYVYSSHFFEHLTGADGLNLMTDCYRVLREGGVFRIVLPNQRKFMEAYLNGERDYFAALEREVELDFDALLDYVNWDVYSCTHKCLYDEDKLNRILRKIGFSDVVATPFQAGMDSELPLRRQYSYYVQATK